MCCHFFRCFGWCLDIVQRLITFLLASILCCALCCGFVIALSAGIAYGYNISVVEYLDLKKADITVYVRRGQFGDKPAFKLPFRRAGGDEPDLFSSNESDYQDHKFIDDTRPLSDAWQKAQDTSNYAEKLTKYSKIKTNIMRAVPTEEYEELFALPSSEPFTEDTTPSFIKIIQFVTESSTTSDGPKMRKFLPEYRPPYSLIDDSKLDTKKIRHKNRKHKHKQTKSKIIARLEADYDKGAYLQPNASQFLYRTEDFEDADVEVNNKPV